MADAIRDVVVRISVATLNQQVQPPKVESVVDQLKKVESQAQRAGSKFIESFAKIGTGAMQAARGIALLSFSGDENLQKLLKQLALLQGAFDVMRGSVAIVKGLTEAHKALAAAAALSAGAQAASAIAGGTGAAAGGVGLGTRLLGGFGRLAGWGAAARAAGAAAGVGGAVAGITTAAGVAATGIVGGAAAVPVYYLISAWRETNRLQERSTEQNRKIIEADRSRLSVLESQRRIIQDQHDGLSRQADKLREINRTLQENLRGQLSAGQSAKDRFAALSPAEQRTMLGLARQGFGGLHERQLQAMEGIFHEQVRQERLRRANPADLNFVGGLGQAGEAIRQQEARDQDRVARAGAGFALGSVGMSLEATEAALEAVTRKAESLDRQARRVTDRLRTIEEGIRNQQQ